MGTFTTPVRSRHRLPWTRAGVFLFALAFATSVGDYAFGQDKTDDKKDTITWEDDEVEGDGKTTIVTEGGGTSGIPPEDLERWPWLGIPVEGLPLIYVKVDVNVSGLADDVGAVGINCRLTSKMFDDGLGTEGAIVGVGYGYFERPGFGLENHLDDNIDGNVEPFDGKGINTTTPILFRPFSDLPMESWTNGSCALSFVQKTRPTHWSDPRVCNSQEYNVISPADPDNYAFWGDCVWPDTDPEDAKLTFERPGLEGVVFERVSDIDDQLESDEGEPAHQEPDD